MKKVKKLLLSTVMGALLTLIVNVSGWASADNPVVGITMGNLQNAFPNLLNLTISSTLMSQSALFDCK